MIWGLSRSAAACSAATSSTARNALSFLRKATLLRLSSCSMKEWPLQVVGGLEGQEGSHPHHDRSKHLIVNVEVVVGEAAALAASGSGGWGLWSGTSAR